MQTFRRLAGLLIIVAVVGACGGAGISTPPSDPEAPVSTDVPLGGGGGGDGGGGADQFMVPKPGQLDVHPVGMTLLEATVDGRRVTVIANWTSGVEPCYVLDSILVEQGDHTFTITIREGHGPGDGVCIEIAQLKRTQVDLGELEPGTYTISDSQGGAAPIEVVVE